MTRKSNGRETRVEKLTKRDRALTPTQARLADKRTQ
jgi:hypothetical protein